MSKSVKFLAFGCTHAPLQDDEHIEWLSQEIRRHKPDYLFHLGDWFEADAARRWPSEYDWDLIDEFAAGNELLSKLRRSGPKNMKCIFLPGNHDDNLLDEHRLPKKIRNICDWKRRQFNESGEWINQELLENWHHSTPYEYDRTTGVYRLGPITFGHGYEAAQNADEMHSILLGVPYGCYIGSHTHRPMPVTQAKKTAAVMLPYWYANTGCSRDLYCHYMKRKRQHNWGQGCVIGDCDPSSVKTYIPTERRWNVETKIRRMF